jgi:hypothetical protein
VLFTKYFSGDQIGKDEMIVACRAYGVEERCIQDFGGEIRGKETTWRIRA